MQITTTNKNIQSTKDIWTLLAAAFVVTLFLGFIDEGYYNFRFLLDPGSIIALGIYAASIFAFEYLFYGVFFKNLHFSGKVIASICCGIVGGFSVAVAFFYGVKYFF